MNEVQEFNPEVSEVYNSNNGVLPESGMLRTQTQYSTAVQVVRPRNLNIVTNRCLEEAAIAGDEFYYSWSQSGSIVEGLTVGAALAIARNFGNCAVDTKVEETPTSYVFYGAFIDLETGFNIVRPFRQNKQSPKTKTGKDVYSGDRGKDIIFQIGASKAIRNVVLNAVPKWLASKVISKAKENVVGKIEKMGIEKTRTLVLNKINALGIDIKRVEFAYGNSKSWDIEKLVMLMGAIRSIEDGIESPDTIFPKIEKEPETKANKTPEVETVTTPTAPAPKQAETPQENATLEVDDVTTDEPNQQEEKPAEEPKPVTFESIVTEAMEANTLVELRKVTEKHKAFIASMEVADKQKVMTELNKIEYKLSRAKK